MSAQPPETRRLDHHVVIYAEDGVTDAMGQALVRVRQGGYGECMMCGDLVNPKRLLAIPWARYCVKCQQLAEREELAQSVNVRDIASEEEE